MKSWPKALVRIEIGKILAYRMNFWVEFLTSSLGTFGIAFFVWSAVFAESGSVEMGGYTFAAMMLYQLLVPILGKATYSIDFSSIGDEIYTGSLNRYLTYPLSFFWYRYLQTLTTLVILFVQLSLALLAYSIFVDFPPGFSLAPGRVLSFAAIVWLSMSLAYLISWSIQLVAFWAESIWSLMICFRLFVLFLGGAWIPLTLFPPEAAEILRLMPFYLLVAFPIEFFMGKLSYVDLGTPLLCMAFWMMVFAGTGAYVWRRGLKDYSGVGI